MATSDTKLGETIDKTRHVDVVKLTTCSKKIIVLEWKVNLFTEKLEKILITNCVHVHIV